MKILVLSDSHSSLSFMRFCIDHVRPDTIIHLGDYVRDGQAIAEEYPMIPYIQLPGNCDLYRLETAMPEIRTCVVQGVKLYMTHGHRHGVKTYLGKLISDARAEGAQLVLYGHTHMEYCEQTDDGMWVMNPGSCGYYGGSCGVVELDQGRILSCRILHEREMGD